MKWPTTIERKYKYNRENGVWFELVHVHCGPMVIEEWVELAENDADEIVNNLTTKEPT